MAKSDLRVLSVLIENLKNTLQMYGDMPVCLEDEKKGIIPFQILLTKTAKGEYAGFLMTIEPIEKGNAE